jgi:aminoglycoside phosphotransferase (APT) family kinase protein
MRPPWTPEFALPRESASRLIAEQFPELAPSLAKTPLEPVGSGWDNDAYRLGTEWLFRFPRRALGVTCIENETRWLPTLARELPLPVPEPRWIGRPGESYPHPFLGSRWIEGTTACSVELSDAERGAIAVPLGRFLARLHAMPVPEGAPEDPAGRKDVPALAAKALEWIGKIERECGEAAAAMRAVERLAGTPEPAGPERWVHGDLYARHLLVDGRRRLAGVIDWGDVHAGDPADDLSIAFGFLRGEAREAFFGAYGEVAAAVRERARLYALRVGGVIAGYGREVGDETLAAAGRTALRFAAE